MRTLSGARACGLALAALLIVASHDETFAQSPTTTSLRSSLNPAGSGESISFTATIAGNGSGAPAGTVQFKDGASALGSAVPVNIRGVGQPIAVGYDFTCALTSAGGVKCWGFNTNGQLGNGNTDTQHAPVPVSGLGSGVIAVTAGTGDYACAVTAAGAALCWGSADNGELGAGPVGNQVTPIAVSGLSSGVIAIAAGGSHTCALTSGGAVKCWGYNANGELGNGGTDPENTPVAVTGLNKGVAAIALGVDHSCALLNTGRVKCWGANNRGQLGNGSMNQTSTTPVNVSGLTNVIAISAGGSHTCALIKTGTVKCWGEGDTSALGNGLTSDQHAPVSVSGLSGIGAIAAGYYHTCAVTRAGAMKCWGANDSGQLGIGTTGAPEPAPVAVSGISGVAAVAANMGHTCALTAAGAVRCWGYNGDGELGTGNTDVHHSPTAVHGFGNGAALVFGNATYTTSTLAAGTHSIRAAYGGDAKHTASNSAVLRQRVQ